MRAASCYVFAVKRDQETLLAHGPDLTGDRVTAAGQPVVGTFNRLWPALKAYDGAHPGEYVARHNQIANSVPNTERDLLPVLAQLKWACDTALGYTTLRRRAHDGGSVGELYDPSTLQIRFKVTD